MKHLYWLTCTLIACLIGPPSFQSLAQGSFPGGRPVRIVVPSQPGPPPDAISRIVAAVMAEKEGWKVLVENKPGALQTIAMSEVLSQPADGLTIFPMTLGALATPSLLPEKGLRLQTDFMAVAKLATGYATLVVHPSLPISTADELVAYLKSHPDALTYSSGGIGTPGHLLGENFKLQTGTAFTIVQYPSNQQRMADLVAGRTHFSFASTPTIVELVAVGKLRALAVAAPKQLAALPGVSTIIEQGFPRLVAEDWVGLVVKGGTDPAIVKILNAAVNRTLAEASVRDRFISLGFEADAGAAGDLQRFIDTQVPVWSEVVRHAGIKVAR